MRRLVSVRGGSGSRPSFSASRMAAGVRPIRPAASLIEKMGSRRAPERAALALSRRFSTTADARRANCETGPARELAGDEASATFDIGPRILPAGFEKPAQHPQEAKVEPRGR